MKVGLLCGQKRIDLVLPDSVHLLETKPVAALPDPAGAVREALRRPIGSRPLPELARGKKSACMVISDVTRPVPNRILLPPLLKALHESGISQEAVTILIATGMHRPNQGEELRSMVGAEIMDQYRIVNHYCRDDSQYRKIDDIDGAPIEINRHYLDADLKILTGLIEPHFYAGYSGGRKSLLPGLSSFETMKFMHSFRMIDHPKVTNCILDGNPFHEYGLRVADLAGVDFLLNVVINMERKIAGVFAGDHRQAHRAGCDMVYRNSVADLKQPVDLVITSGGGYPLDATFYQMSKALICAKNILKKGGAILLVCGCSEGLGSPEFAGIMRSVCSPVEFKCKHCKPEGFVIDQWCAQNIYQALGHAGEVYLYSPGLSEEDVRKMGAGKIEDVQDTVNRLLERYPRAAVSPEGPYVVGMVE
ncbi:MAG: nickel-dependent lactate racemase [Thermodesulfobacteriota bacterium]